MANRTAPQSAPVVMDPDVPESDRARLVGLLGAEVPLCIIRGTFHGHPATILAVMLPSGSIPAPGAIPGAPILAPVAVMLAPEDAPHLAGPEGTAILDREGRRLDPGAPPLHTGVYL